MNSCYTVAPQIEPTLEYKPLMFTTHCYSLILEVFWSSKTKISLFLNRTRQNQRWIEIEPAVKKGWKFVFDYSFNQFLPTSIAKHINICIGIYTIGTGNFLVDTIYYSVYNVQCSLTIISSTCNMYYNVSKLSKLSSPQISNCIPELLFLHLQ